MPWKKILVLLFVCLMSVFSAPAQQPEQRVMKYLAVMDLKCGAGIEKDVCSAMSDLLIEEMVRIGKSSGKFTVIDRANRDKILSEQGFQQKGCVESSCTVDAGRLLGVGRLIVGSITKVGDTYLVSLQIINVQTAAVDTAANERCKCALDGLLDTVINAARKLMGEAPVQPQQPATQPQPAQPVKEAPPKPVLPPDLKLEDIKFIAATPEQQKLCPADMVYVPAGWFMMGCNAAKDSQCSENEHPYHAVYLDAYCIDKYEYPNQTGAKPKAKISWNDAQGICSSLGKKLPTEAQWEKAARGTDGRTYPWGEGLDCGKAKYNDCKPNKAVPAGSHPAGASPYGAMDMAGNLWEWVADWYGENYYQSSPNRNPTGQTSGSSRVLRGGSWLFTQYYLRASNRTTYRPDNRLDYFGARCARTP